MTQTLTANVPRSWYSYGAASWASTTTTASITAPSFTPGDTVSVDLTWTEGTAVAPDGTHIYGGTTNVGFYVVRMDNSVVNLGGWSGMPGGNHTFAFGSQSNVKQILIKITGNEGGGAQNRTTSYYFPTATYVNFLQTYSPAPDYFWPMTSDYVTGDFEGGYALTEVMQSADGNVFDAGTAYYTSSPILANGPDSLIFNSDVGLPLVGNLMDSFTWVFLVRAASGAVFTGTPPDPLPDPMAASWGTPWFWPILMWGGSYPGGDTVQVGLGWKRTASGGLLNSTIFVFDSDPTSELIEDDSPTTGVTDHIVAYRWDDALSELSMWLDGSKAHTATPVQTIPNGPFVNEPLQPGLQCRLRTYNWDPEVNAQWTWMSHVARWDSALSDADLTAVMTTAINGGCGGSAYLFLGDTAPSQLYLGGTAVSKAYMGNAEVWTT